MARRGFAIIFTFLGVAFLISIVGFAALYFLFAREPAVPGNATLVMRVGGDLNEVAAADVVGYLRGVRTPTVRTIVDDLRKAKVDSRVRAGLAEAHRLSVALLGKSSGNPRRGPRFQEVGQADLRLPRIRRRPRVLPGDRRRQGVPDAVERRST